MTAPDRSGRRLDRGLNLMGVLTLFVTVGTLVLAAAAVPGFVTQSSNTAALRRSTELTTCRGLTSAALTGSLAELVLAQTDHQVAKGEHEQSITRGVVAALRDDVSAQEQAVIDADRASAVLDEAAVRLRAKQAAVDAAWRLYREAADEALRDPDRFLAECRERR